MSAVITPTPGRVVWYYPAENDGIGQLNGQPLAAIVAGVHNDNLVNLAVFDAYGNSQQRSNVRLVQPGNERPNHAHATWMPYQVSAAGITPAKQEEAEQLQGGNGPFSDVVVQSESASVTGLVSATDGENDAAPSSSEPTTA